MGVEDNEYPSWPGEFGIHNLINHGLIKIVTAGAGCQSSGSPIHVGKQ